ncbi:MAG: TonB-dependent receptor [Candidatus Kapabacteria bacterium]|nr:TonB-dependent receptor [Candidatus Kapabacteria bacterium]
MILASKDVHQVGIERTLPWVQRSYVHTKTRKGLHGTILLKFQAAVAKGVRNMGHDAYTQGMHVARYDPWKVRSFVAPMHLRIMTICVGTILAASAAAPRAAAQGTVQDTASVQTRVVTVVGNQWLNARADQFLASATIPPALLQRLAPPTVSDVMHVVPGVHVRQYGGLGGLRTVSVRGGGTAQTLVLVQGIRLSSVQNGTVDLGLIPTSMIGSIDVIRGGAAALYGTNAVSGVVDLRLHTPSTSQAWCTVGGGSFDQTDLRAGGTARLGTTSVTAAVDMMRADGTYPFGMRYDGKTYEVNRVNADVSNISGMAHVSGASWNVVTMLRHAQRGVPGPLVDGLLTPSRARLHDDDGVVGVLIRLLEKGAWQMSATGSLRVLDQWFFDPDATVMGPRGIDERYVQRDAMTSILLQYASAAHLVRTRIEAGVADLRGRMLQPDVGSHVIRRSAAAATEWQWLPGFAADATLRAALRADVISDVGTAVSPLLALQWRLAESTMLRASYSYDFRAPSFNELYYLNYGTAGLRPERSHTVNLGLATALTSWLHADADVFAMRTTDQILAVPTSAVATSAMNIGRTASQGLELGLRASLLDDAVLTHWSYTLQDVRDRTGSPGIDGTLLPYVPQEMISLGATYARGDVQASLQWSYVSHRYAQSGEAWPSLLPAYHLLSAGLGIRATMQALGIDLRLQADNLLDARYDVILGYPMPGRSFRVLTTLRWEQQ